MPPTVIAPDELPDTRARHYSQARIDGDHLSVSGMVGRDADFEPVGDDVATQARQAFANLEVVLGEVGLALTDVSMVRSFLVDAKANYPAYEPAYMAAFDEPPYPSHTAVGIEETVIGDFLVEIEVEAWLDGETDD